VIYATLTFVWYLAMHAAGMREFVGVFSGTFEQDVPPNVAALYGRGVVEERDEVGRLNQQRPTGAVKT